MGLVPCNDTETAVLSQLFSVCATLMCASWTQCMNNSVSQRSERWTAVSPWAEVRYSNDVRFGSSASLGDHYRHVWVLEVLDGSNKLAPGHCSLTARSLRVSS